VGAGSAMAARLDTLTISAPADVTVAATGPCGQTYCAEVNYSYTITGGYPPYTLLCNLNSGSMFTVGAHTVSCYAEDSQGNTTPAATFTITISPPATGTAGAPTAPSSGSDASKSGSSASGPSGSAGSSISSGLSSSSGSTASTSQGSVSVSSSRAPTPVIFAPLVTTAADGREALSFTVLLGSSAVLRITLIGQSGRILLRFGANAAKGRTRFTRKILRSSVKKNSHLRLTIVSISHGKKRMSTVALNA